MTRSKLWPRAVLALATTAALAGCAPLIIGGAAVGTALVATDRRTTAAQLEDQTIELKASSRVRDTFGERARVGTTSYNRLVLVTGEAASEADRVAVEQAVQKVENVRSVINEVAVLGSAAWTARSGDAILSGRVKASLVDTKDLSANAFKVVTERGTVYLMGRVTEREANRASDVVRSVPGVLKVVKVFEYITEAELAELGSKPAPK